MRFEHRPPCGGQNQNRDPPVFEILLVPEVLIRGDKSVVFRFSFGNQVAVGKMRPPAFMASIHLIREKGS